MKAVSRLNPASFTNQWGRGVRKIVLMVKKGAKFIAKQKPT
jgi:hypothetical protein